jgi:hypothetical protein
MLHGATTTTEASDWIDQTPHVGNWRDADRALQSIARRRAALDVEEARWLVEARRVQVHRHRGFASFLEYLERVLGYGPRMAMERLKVADALFRSPTLRDGMRDGIPFTAMRELVRVAVPETAAEWVAAAKGKTVRQIEELVSGKRPGDRPTDDPDNVRNRVVRLEISPETYALWREAQRTIATDVGHAVDDDEMVNTLCRAVLGPADAGSPDVAPYQVAVTRCDRCSRGWQDGAGVSVEIGAAAIAVAECDAQRIGRLDAEVPERAVQDITPAVRRHVYRRDHGRCVVPGCRASRNLDLHHIIHREDGGGHDARNLVLVCSGHHAAHHRGERAIKGEAGALEIAFVGAVDHSEDVRAALVQLGFKPKEAWVAVNAGRTHVGASDFDALLRAALRATERGGGH